MRCRILILALAPVLGAFALFNAADLRINASASLPVGLYIVNPNGGFVEFCPDDRGLSAHRHYRARGGCSDGAAPLLKPVIAGPADEIVLSPAGIAVNGNLLPRTAPLEHDTEGRPLSHWPPGRYSAAQGILWVASSYNARSYDSRYFGPIRESAVRARLRPLMVW
ncbi:MAG: conjugative transfer signal peptidase TraF [Bryobacteraceae bacterium]|jgi:conjugative transfer signal peptidase TraF